MLIRSDLLHRHLDRHRHQAQKINTTPLASPTKSLPSPYGNATHSRNIRSMSVDEIPRLHPQEPSPTHIAPGHFVNQHVQPILPAPSNAANGMPLQQCVSPMPMVQNMPIQHEYTIPQTMFNHDMQSNSTNSPVNGTNGSIVIPASPSTSFDVNAKWDHLFQGGGIFEMSSLFGFDAEFGHLTPPEFTVCIP